VEDGPTTTHGGMPFGAAYLAASHAGADIIDPHSYAAPAIAAIYAQYPHIGPVLPAMGYSGEQLAALRQTIDDTDAEVVVSATPIDLAALLDLNKPVVRTRYEFAEGSTPGLREMVERFLTERHLPP
jgi:predicted GTPase